MAIRATDDGFSLQMGEVVAHIVAEHQEAQKDPRENIIKQLTKLGGTPYECLEVDIPEQFNYFIPSSLLSELRRQAVSMQKVGHLRPVSKPLMPRKYATYAPQVYHLPYLYNVSNHLARQFYDAQGIKVGDAFEVSEPKKRLLMQCRHCLRYALGYCVKNGGRKPEWREPLALRLGDGRSFRLEFDCSHCQMNVYADE